MSKVVIYDSGVGGLSIYQAVKLVCPMLDYAFVSDNKAFPYGTKPEPELLARVDQVVSAIAKLLKPDLLVVACNTASTLALPMLRAKQPFPVVGVVPAIKPAVALSSTKHIALLATPATISRAYTQSLINEFASACTVTKIGSSELVQLAEDKLRGKVIDLQLLEEILIPVLSNVKIDTLVLACTHFPLLEPEINTVLNANHRTLQLVDSGAGIARRVAQLLSQSESNVEHRNSVSRAFFTRTLNASYLNQTLHNLGFCGVEVLDTSD